MRLGVDVGGTFTDAVLYGDKGNVSIGKTLTTHDPIDGVLAALDTVCHANQVGRENLESLAYGTTAAVNALLTRTGARVGLLTTKGFGQILHLARSQTPGPLVGWMNMIKPAPLADLTDTREVLERIRADGSVETPLDEEQLRRDVQQLIETGIDAVAVGFLNSYANPRHEQRTAELIAQIDPKLPISLSSEIHPEYREYDRVVTTVANAYVMPTVARHLHDIHRRLQTHKFACSVDIVRSDGGRMSASAATRRPIDTVFSGPSGGVTGALAIATAAGLPNILTLDMGGTSTDVAACLDGQAVIARETNVGGFPLRAASVDVRSIGAGGGSIAYIPSTMRSLRVGPQSAGADPGPACYGRGGTEPTVTDANLVLGRLPAGLLGGEFQLDRAAATNAVARIAKQLGLTTTETATGIIDIINQKMAGALRVISVERGLDPREFALVAFGGAGPLHANALAELLGCFPVVIPLYPGVQSAVGFHAARKRTSFARTLILELTPSAWPQIEQAINLVGGQVSNWLAVEAKQKGAVYYSCDVRFVRQGYEVEIPFANGDIGEDWLGLIQDRFKTEHERLYGFLPDAEIELVTLRAEGRCPSNFRLPTSPVAATPTPPTPVATDSVSFGGEAMPTPIYPRARLSPGNNLDGPALITQSDTTTLVLPGYSATIDEFFNIAIDPLANTKGNKP
jgi:N-methylhydantoinase A